MGRGPLSRPTFDELAAIARGAVDAVELEHPGFIVVVIVQEPSEGLAGIRARTAAQGNVTDGDGAAICRETGALWERTRTL